MRLYLKNTVLKKSTEGQNMTRLPTNELEEAFKELKPNAFKVLVYYYSKGDGWEFRHEVMARDLNMKPSTVRTRTRELISKGYLLIVKGSVTNYFVGKKEVLAYTPDKPELY